MKPREKALSAQQYLNRLVELDTEKAPWMIHYQALAEIFLTRKMDFTRVLIPGQFLQSDVFDNTGQFSAYVFASLFLSMMWPDASRTFRLKPAYRLRNIPGTEDYFRWASEVMHEAMDRPKAGLSMALMEHFLDSGIFGISGIATFPNFEEDPELPVVYDAWGVKNMCVAETAQGYVDTIYYTRPLTVRQIILEYCRPGDYLPPIVLDKYKNNAQHEKLDVVVVIEPKVPERREDGSAKGGRAGMAVRTVHILKGHGERRLREGGYQDMPVAVGRLFKQLDEPYGRSCGMLALPDAQSLNILTEGVLVATEKSLDPPLAVMDDGRLGGGVIDTSARAINVFNTAGRPGNEKPIFPIITIGEFEHAIKQQENLAAKIAQAFFLDRLLDLNNQTQMTAYETSVRDKIRGESVGGIFSRQEKEVVTPTIETTFNVLFRAGYLGVVDRGIGADLRRRWDKIVGAERVIVPPAIREAHRAGLNVFEIEYISPAKRFQQAEKLRGLMTATDSILAVAPLAPQVLDGVDLDKWRKLIVELSGAPVEVSRTDEALKKFRAANRQAADAQRKLDQQEQGANIGLKAAQSRAALGTIPAVPAGSRA